MNHRIDNNGNLTDSRGKVIGKVDHFNRVYDGYRQKGHIDDNGRYHDEYGRDQGWTSRDTGGGGSGAAAAGLVGLIILILVALFGWILGNPARRKAFLVILVVGLITGGIYVSVLAAKGKATEQARQEEMAWVRSYPDQAYSYYRVGDGECRDPNNIEPCQVTTGVYSFTSHLKVGFVAFTSIYPTFNGPGTLEPGQTKQVEIIEWDYGKVAPICFTLEVHSGGNEPSIIYNTYDNPLCLQ